MIASNTKLFTTVALALLVDEGKLKWTSKIKELLPEFRHQDPYLQQEITLIDALSHRTGLAMYVQLIFRKEVAHWAKQA